MDILLLVVGMFYFWIFLCGGRLIWLAVLLCKTSDSNNMSSYPIEESNSNIVQSIPKGNQNSPNHLWKKHNRSDLMRPGIKGQERNSEEVSEREIPHIIIHSPIQATYECESVI